MQVQPGHIAIAAMELHGARPHTASPAAQRADATERLQQIQHRRPDSATSSGSSGGGRGPHKAQSHARQRPTSAPAGRRPTSAPAGRRGSRGKPVPPQVNMNKASPLGTAPRWTIPGKPSDAALRVSNPGPGAYDLCSPDAYWCKRKPACSIAGRSKSSGSVGPGPARFVPFRPTGPGCTIGKRFSHVDEQARSPGPAAYDLPDCKSRMKKSISKGVMSPDSRGANPGPGTYAHADQFNDPSRPDAAKIGFPKALRTWGIKTGPEPGAYDPAG